MNKQDSLLKYDTPSLVSTSKGKGDKKKVFNKVIFKKCEKSKSQTEDILNSILPPM